MQPALLSIGRWAGCGEEARSEWGLLRYRIFLSGWAKGNSCFADGEFEGKKGSEVGNWEQDLHETPGEPVPGKKEPTQP